MQRICYFILKSPYKVYHSFNLSSCNADLWIGKKNILLKIEKEHFSSSNYMAWYFTPTFQLLSLKKNEYTISLPRFVAGLQRKTSVEEHLRVTWHPCGPQSQGDHKETPCFTPMSWWRKVRGHKEHGYVHSQRGWRVMEWQIQAKCSNLHLSHLNMEEKRKTWIGKR